MNWLTSFQLQDRTQAFAATILGVLETAVFAFGDLEETTADAACARPVAVTIELGGEMDSVLTLAGPPELFAGLASDMMGTDSEEVTDEQRTDFMAELANMIAGRWATEALGEEAEVPLSIPEPVAIDAERWKLWLDHPGALLFRVEEHLMLVVLSGRDEGR